MILSSPKPRSVFSAVCRSNGIVLGRTRATVGSRFSLNASLASASHSNPAAFILPGGGPLRRSVEPTRTPMAPLLRIFSRGPREILNLFGAFKALRSLSSNALVQFLQEPASSIFHRLTLAPVLSPVPVLHASNRHQKDTRDHGKSYAQHG